MTPTNGTPPTNGNHPRNGAGPAADPWLLRALAGEVEAAGRRLGALEERTGLVDRLLAQLASDVALLAPDEPENAEDDPPAPVRSWLAVRDPQPARAELADLVAWVAAVYVRYPGGSLPSCWLWHPSVVEELCWLRHAHQAAHHGRGASWREVADWHDRLRPGVARRIGAVLGACELGRHTPDGDRHQPAADVPLTAAADAVAEHWAGERATPDPTPEQLVEAEAHDRAQLRSHR